MSAGKITVVVAAADIESGVTSWALRFRDACRNHPRLDVKVVNCWQTNRRVGSFDAEITSVASMKSFLSGFTNLIVVPNFIWEIIPLCAELAQAGQELRVIGYAHSDSEAEYYAPSVWLEPLTAAFLTASPEIADKLVERIPHRRDDIVNAPCGVEVPPALQRSWQTTPLRLMYGGRIVQEQKRVLDFIPLVAALLERSVDFHFDVMGSGAQLQQLRDGLNALPHGGRVCFPGSVPAAAMADIWREHDVFLQVSSYEGTSCSMLEAMAQGCVPLVTDASSGVRGVIHPGVNGALVPIGDMTALADYIADLANDKGTLERLGLAAHASVEPYSMPRYIEIFERAVDRAMAQAPRVNPSLAWQARHARAGTPLESRRALLQENALHRVMQAVRQRFGKS